MYFCGEFLYDDLSGGQVSEEGCWPGEIRQVKRCVNAMEIALDEIDEYEPGLFFRIVERLAPIIEGKV